MSARLACLAAFLGLLVGTPALLADSGCGKVKCPRCHYECRLSVEREPETRHGWEVECRAICVPRINLPWKSCCAPKCAWVKTVKVLKRHEYECQQCHYKWTAVPTCRCGHCRAEPQAPAPELAEPAMAARLRHLPAPVHVAPAPADTRPAWLQWLPFGNFERPTSNVERRLSSFLPSVFSSFNVERSTLDVRR